jgi:hypothetical protein
MKQLSLLEQTRIVKKERELAGRLQVKEGMTGSEMISILLPNYDQQTKPRLFHDAVQLHKGIRGGVRSGKTYTVEAESIRASYLNRPYYHLSVSPSFDLACVTVIPTLQELCETNNLHYDWMKSNNLFQINFGSAKKDIANILIFGADSNFKGITAASGDLNEPFSIPKDKSLVWWERISHPKAKYMLRMWGGTAEPDKMSWGHEYYKMKTNKKIYLDTFTTYDNKFLTAEYIKSLEDKYDPRMRRVYMLGECLNLSADKVYHQFMDDVNILKYDNVIPLIKKQDSNIIIESFDFNISPMCATEHWVNGHERIQVDEYKILSSNTRELAELMVFRIKQRYDLKTVSFIITGDASGKQGDTRSQDRTYNDYVVIKEVFDQYPKINYSFHVPPKNPFIMDRVNYVNNLFFKKLFSICDNCKESIEDRELMLWKRGAEGFHIDKSNKDRTHLSDSGDYALWNTQKLTDKPDSAGNDVYAEYSDRW